MRAYNKVKIMRDPHIQRIYYIIYSEKGISYDDPKPISFSNHLGDFDLTEGQLQIIPTEHFPKEDLARQAIEPFLRSWEIEADLTSNIGTIRFKFEKVEVIDRNPPPPGSPQVIHAQTGHYLLTGGNVSFHLTKKNYPNPPRAFSATAEVQYAYRRWLGYQQGNEPLQSMAYFVLTILQSLAGNRQAASNSFQIDLKILNTIGRLSSTKGDETTARKATSLQFQELTDSEKLWLDEATRRVIYRLGEHASGAPLTQISLVDLPKI